MLKPLLRGSLAATLLVLGPLAQADSFKHFRHMVFRESPVEDLRGRYEISPEGARTTLHHRFRYDDQGRLTEVRRAVGDTVTRNPGSGCIPNWRITSTWLCPPPISSSS